MDNINIIDEFIKIYEVHILDNSIEYDGSNFIFEIKSDNLKYDLNIIETVFDDVDNLPSNKVSLKLANLKIKNFLIFYKQDDFLKKYRSYSTNFNELSLLILDEKNKTIFKGSDEKFSKEKALIFNNNPYQQILNLLKSNNIFSSIKSHNNEIIIVSKENSVIHIGYKNYDLRISELDDLLPDFYLLKKRFEKIDFSERITDNSEYIKLFIETISTAGIGNYDLNDRFFEIVKGLKIIISLTERDYDNYINNFSFEKLKSKFKEERNKYFENLEKNIDLVSKQVVSFPLTFAATAFASYQVKDKPWILILVLAGYSLYTFIAIKILHITSYNVECLENDITKEEEIIKNSYSKNHNDFEEDFEKIRKKTNKIKDLVFYLKIILFIMLFLFFVYSIFQIFFQKSDRTTNNILIPIEKIKYISIDTLEKNFNKNNSDEIIKLFNPYTQMKNNDSTINKEAREKAIVK